MGVHRIQPAILAGSCPSFQCLHSPLVTPHSPPHSLVGAQTRTFWKVTQIKRARATWCVRVMREPVAMYRSTDWAGPYPRSEPSDRSSHLPTGWRRPCVVKSSMKRKTWKNFFLNAVPFKVWNIYYYHDALSNSCKNALSEVESHTHKPNYKLENQPLNHT